MRLKKTLDPNTVLAEGYKEYDTGRTYMVSMGDWRKNKDEEVELDGIGGVNILVKADVHRSGMLLINKNPLIWGVSNRLIRHQLPLIRFREPGRN
jgi:Anp1